MLKRLTPPLALLLMCLLLAGWYTPPESVGVYVDGHRTDKLRLSYITDGTTYVPLEEVAEALGATAVVFDPNDSSMRVDAVDLTITARVGDRYIVANGRYIFVPDGVALYMDRVMIPARALGRAFGAEVLWLPVSRAVYFRTGGEPIESGSAYYGDDDVYWLSRLIYAEAGGESLDGKIAVGNVVLNRVADAAFPDTVKGVIFDTAGGVQFTPVASGAIYNDPPEECVIAAKLALDGANTAGASLYFTAADVAESCWAARHREVYIRIDNQVFFT